MLFLSFLSEDFQVFLLFFVFPGLDGGENPILSQALSEPIRINIKLTIFQTTNNLTLPPKMTNTMVESAWDDIAFFSSTDVKKISRNKIIILCKLMNNSI